MLKTVIMDFDGLIVDTEVVWYHIYVDWFKTHKKYNLTVEEFLTCVGSNSDALFDQMNKKGIFIDCKKFAQDTQTKFLEESNKLPAKRGVEKFLHTAKSLGLYVVLATSSTQKKPVFHLNRLGLMQYFDAIVTAEQVENIKPFPDLFFKAAEYTGSKPSECLVVEDSVNGLIAGKKAGMRVLVVPNDVTKYANFNGEYRRINSLEDVDLKTLINDF